jgi:peroxiredoxin
MITTVLNSLLLSASLGPGALAPDFTAKDTDGNTLTLSKLLTEGPVILAFFPKAFTPG